MRTEKVFVWRLTGWPVGTMGDRDDHFDVKIVTLEKKIPVRQFKKLLGAAFTDAGRESFVGSQVFNKLVVEILKPSKKGENRKVPSFRHDMSTGFHTWRWELLGDASLTLNV